MKKSFWSPFLSALTPYTAGEQPQDRRYVKLNTNEIPIRRRRRSKRRSPPFPSIGCACILRPTPTFCGTRSRKRRGVSRENVFCGNGSDEVLALCVPAFFKGGRGAAFADITYSFYPVFCDFFSVPYTQVPLKEDYTMDLAGLGKADADGVFFTNPNAPTGIGVGMEETEKFVAENPGKLIVADEAYMGFFGQSALPLTKKISQSARRQDLFQILRARGYPLPAMPWGMRRSSAGCSRRRTASTPIPWTPSARRCARRRWGIRRITPRRRKR